MSWADRVEQVLRLIDEVAGGRGAGRPAPGEPAAATAAAAAAATVAAAPGSGQGPRWGS